MMRTFQAIFIVLAAFLISANCLSLGNSAADKKENNTRIVAVYCKTNADCRSVEKCVNDIDGQGSCICRNGRTGDKCEIVYDCLKGKYKYCYGKNGRCWYNDEKETAECDCGIGKKFDISGIKCRDTCKDDCANSGTCEGDADSKFCRCKRGTTGDHCEIVEDCKLGKICGNWKDVKCVYNENTGSGNCLCDNSNKYFDYVKKECRVPCNDDCLNGGKCEYVQGNGFCSCKNGTSGDHCETVEACVKKKICGMKTDVKCLYDEVKENATCKCDDSKKSFDSNGKVCRMSCDSTDDCRSFEKCTQLTSVEMFCRCPPGKRGEECEIVEDCVRGKYKDCKGVNKTCFYNTEKEIAECDCGVGKKWDAFHNSCRTTCEDNCANDGLCEDKGNVKFCKCRSGTSGDLCKTVSDCLRYQFCGYADVKCVYDKSTNGGKCLCKNSTKLFRSDKKICQVPCKDDCHSSGKCEFILDNRYCTCKKGTSGDFCEKIDECGKNNFCGTRMDVKCVYDIEKERAKCKCDDPKKLFESYYKKCFVFCNSNDDCQSFEKCTKLPSGGNFVCRCPPGKSGEHCEVVDDCVTGELKYCKGNKGRCFYNTEKETAECDCGVGKKWRVLSSRCYTTCEDNCAHDGLCEDKGDVKFCRCKSGTSGDLCETVNDCRSRQFCGTDRDVTCVYDKSSSRGKCLCENSTKSFHVDKKKCYVPCKDDCHNGGKCDHFPGNRFCFCKNGTSGDLCETVNECVEKNFCGTKADVKCLYDEAKEEATCKCNDPKKLFDLDDKECHISCSTNDDCQIFEKCAQLPSGDKLCRCPPGRSGERCEIIDECISGIYRECKGDNGRCFYSKEKEKAECDCGIGKIWGGKLYGNRCRIPCKGDCKHGGVCDRYDDYRLCVCQPGTSGDFCETVDDCSLVPNFCGINNDVQCEYDALNERGKCTCEDPNKLFDPDAKECRTPCFYNCQNNGICKNFGQYNFCRCKPGTRGDLCSKVDDCYQDDLCGTKDDVKCVYDGIRGATCKCENKIKLFDVVQKQCRIPCKYGCFKDGKCEGVGEDMFCRCKPGISGDLCTVVDHCAITDLCGTKDDVQCIYDERKDAMFCKCDDSKKHFDPKTKECRNSEDACGSYSCQNGGICNDDGNGSPRCYCKAPFSGERCEEDNRKVSLSTLVLLVLVALGLINTTFIGCCLFKVNQKLKNCKTSSGML